MIAPQGRAVVIDASVPLTALLPGNRSDTARRVLLGIADAGADVPGNWHLEVGNGLLAAERRGLLATAARAAAMRALGALPVRVDTETSAHAWGETARLARDYGLGLADAAYLELALRLEAVLVTFDATLLRAARAAGARDGVPVMAGNIR